MHPSKVASRFLRIVLCLSACSALLNDLCAAIRVETNFEGASANVLHLDAATQTIRISPAGNPQRGMPTWWYLRVDDIDTNRPLVLEVVALNVTTPSEDDSTNSPLNPGWTLPDRATISADRVRWRHTDRGERSGNRSIYRVMPEAGTLWLAWGPPFTPVDASMFVDKMARTHSFAEKFVLAESREKRDVPALRISEGNRPSTNRPAIWVHARQHAWECGSSWVAVGLAEWLAGDDADAKWLRQNAEVWVTPVMDVDHVATGDGGKHARPRDHNRDWSETPHWPEVAAAQKHLLALAAQNRLAFFLDLHNPSPGARVQSFYAQYPPYISAHTGQVQEPYFDALRGVFGEIRLLNGNPGKPEHLPIWKRISTPWVCEHGNPDTVSLTVETPWNVPEGTPAGYRDVGRKLGVSMTRFLQSSSTQPK